MAKENKVPITVKVVKQGVPALDATKGCHIHGIDEEDTVIFEVPLRIQHCEADGVSNLDGLPTINLKSRNFPQNADLTIISFPEYKGWSVWVAKVFDEDLRVCLVRGFFK